MKTSFIYLFVSLCIIKANAQVNLVPNPSFEDTINCPNGIGQINKCMYWYNPNTMSPDYFNSCADPVTTGVSVPLNSFGYQYARTGNAYAGIYVINSPFTDAREYIQTQLIDSLKKDSIYCVSFYVCLDNYSNTAITTLGLYISDDSLTSTSYLVFSVIPQIVSPTNTYLNDTINWVQVSDYYIAHGGEKHITIGNFKNDFTTDTISWNINDTSCFPFCYPTSHYYIDDVSIMLCDTNSTIPPPVLKISSISIPNIFTPNDDQMNDVFKIIATNITSLTCKLYNRWGIIVGELKDVNDFWDGRTTSGIECTDGVYYYILVAEGEDGKEYDEKGFLQLIK